MEKNEHVDYEWQMLKACRYVLNVLRKGSVLLSPLIPGSEDQNGEFLFNIVHEDYCVHARNLMCWAYDGHDKLMPDDIATICGKIDAQITTLVPGSRTSKVEEKINQAEREVLFEHLEHFME